MFIYMYASFTFISATLLMFIFCLAPSENVSTYSMLKKLYRMQGLQSWFSGGSTCEVILLCIYMSKRRHLSTSIQGICNTPILDEQFTMQLL